MKSALVTVVAISLLCMSQAVAQQQGPAQGTWNSQPLPQQTAPAQAPATSSDPTKGCTLQACIARGARMGFDQQTAHMWCLGNNNGCSKK